jgi:hypothetical protein
MTPSAQTAGGRRVTRWTRELIIEKIVEWHARYGEAPCSADWNPSLAIVRSAPYFFVRCLSNTKPTHPTSPRSTW